MARLIIQTEGFDNRVIELGLGVNRVGRDPDYEIYIEHETISLLHCEIRLNDDGVYVHDCKSTNGTFVNGESVMEAWLDPGQILRVGDVELFVESTEAPIGIPNFTREQSRLPMLVENSACPDDPETPPAFICTHCRQTLSVVAVRVIRYEGGQPLFLCPICNHRCERIETERPKRKRRSAKPKKKKTARSKRKKGLFGFLEQTVGLKLVHGKKKK